jgi:predicted DNA-binding protein with PD1-like motif
MWAVIFATDDDFLSELGRWVESARLRAASLTGIGGFRRAVLGYYDLDARSYIDIPVEDQVEVLALAGDITCRGEEHQIHAHVVCGRRDGSTVGGHVQQAVVRPTLEVVVAESPTFLERSFDRSSGLALIDLESAAPAPGRGGPEESIRPE